MPKTNSKKKRDPSPAPIQLPFPEHSPFFAEVDGKICFRKSCSKEYAGWVPLEDLDEYGRHAASCIANRAWVAECNRMWFSDTGTMELIESCAKHSRTCDKWGELKGPER
jgi:hypothetical protein